MLKTGQRGARHNKVAPSTTKKFDENKKILFFLKL
jgi:hypothetical protein